MAFSFSFSTSFSNAHLFSSCFSSLPQSTPTTRLTSFPQRFSISIKAVNTSEPAEAEAESKQKPTQQISKDEPPPPTPTPTPKRPSKPVYSMKKGQIVRVDKEKYLNSINYLSVGHPPYFKGLDYIYEDRGEVLDIRNFETGEYALIAWVGIPTSPAWLPTDMLIKSDKLDYERM